MGISIQAPDTRCLISPCKIPANLPYNAALIGKSLTVYDVNSEHRRSLMANPYHIFISRSWTYSDACDKVVNLLNARGYFPFKNDSVPPYAKGWLSLFGLPVSVRLGKGAAHAN